MSAVTITGMEQQPGARRPGTLTVAQHRRQRDLSDTQVRALADVLVADALLGGALAALPGGSGDSVEARSQAGVEAVADGLRQASSHRLSAVAGGLVGIGTGTAAGVGAMDGGWQAPHAVLAFAAVVSGAVAVVNGGAAGSAQREAALAVDALSTLAVLQQPYFSALQRARTELHSPHATDRDILRRAGAALSSNDAKHRCTKPYKTLLVRHARLLEAERTPEARPSVASAPVTSVAPRPVTTAMEQPRGRTPQRGR